MLTEEQVIDSMINLATAFRTKDPYIYYYYVEVMRDLLQFADENDIDICDADLWY